MKKLYHQYAYFLNEQMKIFNFQNFRKLPTLEDKQRYAAESLPLQSNEGGGRLVFDMGNKVLKVARNDKDTHQGGLQQNKKEIVTYLKQKGLDFFPKLYAYDPDFHWSVFEKVETFPYNQKNALEPYLGLYDDELETLFGYNSEFSADQVFHPEKYPELTEEILEATDFGSDWRNNPYIKKIEALIAHGIHPEELLVKSHYGITKDGKLVFVDFGH